MQQSLNLESVCPPNTVHSQLSGSDVAGNCIHREYQLSAAGEIMTNDEMILLFIRPAGTCELWQRSWLTTEG